MEYTFDPTPTREKYQRAFRALSTAIDEMRGVYRNVGEDDQYIGLYPYEPLHDMRRALADLGFAQRDEAQARHARARILQAWNALRPRFVTEFNPPEPTEPIYQRGASDPRRPSQEEGGAKRAEPLRFR